MRRLTNAVALTAMIFAATACASDDAAQTGATANRPPASASKPEPQRRAPDEARFENAHYAFRFPVGWQLQQVPDGGVSLTNAQGLSVVVVVKNEWTCHRAETMALLDKMAYAAQPEGGPNLALSITDDAPRLSALQKSVEGVRFRLGDAPGYTLTGYALCPLYRRDAPTQFADRTAGLVVVVQGPAPVVDANQPSVGRLLESLTLDTQTYVLDDPPSASDALSL